MNIKTDISCTAMTRKMICKYAVFAMTPYPKQFVLNAPACFDGFERALAQIDHEELAAHLTSYSERLMLFWTDDGVIAVLPTLYPSSSLGVAFMFEMTPAEFLRLAAACNESDMFVYSNGFPDKKARLGKKIREQVDEFKSFFTEVRACFLKFERFNLCIDIKERLAQIAEQCARLARFTGCPTVVAAEQDGVKNYSFDKLDFPLLSAFVLTVLMTARRYAIDRSAEIFIYPQNSSALVSIKLNASGPKVKVNFSEFKSIAYDKNMLFDINTADGSVIIRLDPCRSEWSLLGLKQWTEYFDLNTK